MGVFLSPSLFSPFPYSHPSLALVAFTWASIAPCPSLSYSPWMSSVHLYTSFSPSLHYELLEDRDLCFSPLYPKDQCPGWKTMMKVWRDRMDKWKYRGVTHTYTHRHTHMQAPGTQTTGVFLWCLALGQVSLCCQTYSSEKLLSAVNSFSSPSL